MDPCNNIHYFNHLVTAAREEHAYKAKALAPKALTCMLLSFFGTMLIKFFAFLWLILLLCAASAQWYGEYTFSTAVAANVAIDFTKMSFSFWQLLGVFCAYWVIVKVKFQFGKSIIDEYFKESAKAFEDK